MTPLQRVKQLEKICINCLFYLESEEEKELYCTNTLSKYWNEIKIPNDSCNEYYKI